MMMCYIKVPMVTTMFCMAGLLGYPASALMISKCIPITITTSID